MTWTPDLRPREHSGRMPDLPQNQLEEMYNRFCPFRFVFETFSVCVNEQLQQQRLSAMTAIVQALERGLREELNRLTALQEAA